MPPKANIPTAKLQAILAFFHTTLTAHPLKDLEKLLPPASGISGMQVKDALQALVDDSLLRVEKIGSGNWYWAFVGDERKRLETGLKSLGDEREALRRVVGGLKEVLAREGERVRIEGGGEDIAGLVAVVGRLKGERDKLTGELEGYRDGDPMEIERRRGLVVKVKAVANQTTDNIYVLLSFIRQSCGDDKETMQHIWSEYLGGAGEGGGEGELDYAE